MFEKSGKFHLIDVRTGLSVIDAQLESAPDLRSIHTVRDDDTLFLMVSNQVPRQQQQPQHKPVDQLEGLVTSGLVYAFSMKDGKPLWPGPATIRNRGLVAQPEDIPFLVFLDRQTSSDGTRGVRRQLRLLCLDKRTGKTVYRNDNLPDAPVTRFRIRSERRAPHVTIETNAGTIRLAMSDRPGPPRPPTNDDLETARSSAKRGLVGLGQRVGAALRGTIGNEPDANREGPPQMDDD
jgi:hypothetical protein